TVRVGKDGLAAKLVYDFLEACRDFVQSLVPTDALERRGFPFSPWALGANSFHGEERAAGGVNPIQIFRHLGAKKSSGYGMAGVALDFGRLAVVHGNKRSEERRVGKEC